MIKNLINLLFPPLCVGCNSILLQNENIICLKCRHELPFTDHPISAKNTTYTKFYGRLSLEYAFSLLYYRKKGIAQQLIHHLKYNNKQEIGTLLAEWYLDRFRNHSAFQDITTIIPVPLHKRRLEERGYNQLTRFGQTLAEGLHIQYNETLLYRDHYSKTQTRKNIFNRTEINSDLFNCHASERDFNKHFLLIDDVITSGATLEACGKQLLKIPGAKLSIATIAYTDT
ncbi:ComF family protein [Flavobacterium cerinum]|uniref:ComF family protein n=1 Tax=Flavobacterium cerinum TaxID=2502784 RepID=A0ABY5IXN1_9FLAO|nr:double zinc ribbon domain-containing protein [Flavobacterium cerinum]UUC46099.1 ComF family protein [Flavobacterium cerinum]